MKFKLGRSSKSSKQTDTYQTETAHSVLSEQGRQGLNCEAEPQEDDDSIPQTEDEARGHIAKIRAEKGLHGTDSNTADLQAALVVLSEQLYQKSTHFLLELVQNVDDNSYQVLTPTLEITYEKRTLRIDCNEIGFSKKNVAAICRIGRSSKSGLDHSRRYIGEKGIGFKSVFKVSNVVWIRSGHYSFQFDKSKRLGMIAPIWEKFPAKALHGFTSILLQLSQDYDVTELIREIKALDPRLLIFLQKLKKINIKIIEGGIDPWETSLERHDEPGRDGRQQLVTLSHRSSLLTYRIFRLQVKQLPHDPKRAEFTESELLLAFPLSDPNESKIESQNVYAFLPIRDYGFKFLLQADFLLIASREDIDSSSPWNKALLDRIPNALHGAIIEFNDGEFRYSWLPYLPFRPYVADFFKQLEDETINLLRTSPILESFEGELKPPSGLIYVPEPFTDTEGKPLILTPSTKSRYLSHKYPSSEWDRLSKLGVKSLSTENFIDDLRKFILRHPNDFREMPDKWQSRLAEALLSSIHRSKFWKSTISALQIVPLRDGNWVSLNDGNLLFPSRSNTMEVPKGIDIFEIHPSAETDYFRRQLFMVLGAKEFQAEQICDIIIRTHEKSEFRPETLSTSDLISHVVFLYRTGWKNTDRRDIWFVTETGLYCRGSHIYMDSDVTYSAKSIFEHHREKVPFLHQDYYNAFSSVTISSESQSEAGGWQEWLVEHMNVAQIPRLATPSIGAPFSISKDFQFLVETYLSTELLLLIRHHWKYYSKWIVDRERNETKTVWETSQRKIRNKISSMDVKCRRGLISPLNKTFLPLSSMQLESFVSVPFLDVPEPDDDRWDYLKHFGVVVELDANFFVECLRRLKETKTSRKQVSQLYGQINYWATRDNADVIRRSFETHQLVFISSEDNDSVDNWMSINECVWSGPKCLRATPCLEKYYPEHQSLLRDSLRLGDADIKTLVSEARRITPNDSIDQITQIFIAISKYLEISNTGSAVQSLAECPIFPVVTGSFRSDFDSLYAAAGTDMWFIADRMYLKESFDSLVPLLAVHPEIVEKLSPFIDALELERRLLSKVAKGVSKTKGRVELHHDYTRSLRKKARCIARLVPRECPNRAYILKQLRRIEVYQSEKVIVEWVVTTISGETHYGRADSGRVASKPGQQGLKIFLTEEDINANLPPLELQEELANFGEIKDSKHFTLLLYLLMQDDLKSIEDTFQRRGIPNDIPEFDSSNGMEDEEKTQLQPQILESGPKDSKFPFRRRRKRFCDSKSSKGLGDFIRNVERISNLQKKIADPWGASDVSGLFSRICKMENQDAASLLPQGSTKSGRNSDDPVGSLFDLKTGMWKEMMIREEDPKRPETEGFGNVLSETREAFYAIDEETQYIGELTVSTFLETHLGEAYAPSIHWTNNLRSRAGHMPYDCHQVGVSTFTMADNGDAFTKFLAKWGYVRAATWNKSPVYHIKVVVSKMGLLSEFFLDPIQVKKAQDCSMLRDKFATPTEVFILISVYNIQTDPGIALFVDPWQMHVNQSLSLLAYSPYHASFKDTTSAIFLQGSPEILTSGKPAVVTAPNNPAAQTCKKRGKPSRNPTGADDGLLSYRPLRNPREMRLLELFPGKDDMPLEGVIHHVSVDSPGQYCAISYAWGAALKPFYFQTPEGKIPLTVSLHGALHCVRDSEVSTLLWADAICIDQESSLEKSLQIRLMRTIFQAAEGVIAWLGDEKDNSDRAIETLLQIRMMALKPDVWPHHLPAIPFSWAGRNIPSLTDNIWKDINLLLSRDWFRRSWIVQELILASDVRISCGGWTLHWDDFFEALKICREAMQSEMNSNPEQRLILDHIDPAYALGLTRQSRLMFNDVIFGRRYNLLELLDLFAYTKATRERDKLFALLGLASDCTGEAFDPDYESSMEAIVRRYANEFVRRGHAMDLLYRAGISKSYPFCSWIPFWTRGNFPKTISSWRGEGGNFCAGGKGLPRAHLLPINPSTMVVRGFSVDTIIQISDTRMDKSDIICFLNSIHSSIDQLKSYPTGESRQELKLKLPTGSASRPYLESTNGSLPGQIIAFAESKREDWPSDLAAKMASVGSIQELMNFLRKPQDAREVVWKYWQTAAAFARRLSNGTFCVTKRGYVAIVPGDARVGDEVCIFSGGAVPFVLRRDGDGGGKGEVACRLVGEGYVHGFMYGEALCFKGVREQEFHIV